ncbi:MAG: MarR family transcriptional regulator [Bacteroidota bacterium]
MRTKAMVNLIYTNNWMQEIIKKRMKTYDITLQQYNVLRILRGAGAPISTSTIRERMLDKMCDASRMVCRLHARGWVNRCVCEFDKRLVDISLTDEGQNLLDKIDADKDDLEHILSNLTEEEATVLSDLLDKARAKANKH